MIGVLKEGGNVFKDIHGRPLTQRINQTDVKPTLAWLEEMLPGLDVQGNTLGSTGIKDTSGDLDIAVDVSQLSKLQLTTRLQQWAQSHGFKPEDYVKQTGAGVHFKTPIAGNPANGYVQSDFMFLKNIPWSKFVLGAMPADSQYKGRERNVLMNSLAKSMGYKLNQLAGIADRNTNELITDDPDKVAKMLLNPRATRADLASVESILAALEKDPKRDTKLADFKAHMEREGLPFMESTDTNPYTEVSDVNFLARLRDRIVNQGMVALVEAAAQNVGGRAKGIEHIEDLVFRKGTNGIKEALSHIEHLKDNTKQAVTVKWDGKPAVIWGRRPDGQFVLTDTSGFTAVGYDGLFVSPRQLTNQMAQRDAAAAEKGNVATRVKTLAPIYQQMWPMLEAATPEDFRGYIQGDLLYTQTPPEQAGNFVFKPNTIEYDIPAASKLGQQIANSDIGIAIHTRYKEPGAPKQPLGKVNLNPVPGLLLIEPIRPTENVTPTDSAMLKQLKSLVAKQGSAINTLFDPAELRAQGITDLPKLCVDYINSLVGNDEVTTFDVNALLPGFGAWLKTKVTPSKFNNIVEYLQSPRSNTDGITAAFTAFVLLHNIKIDLLTQLDRQHPGQEGWVVATPGGITKFVNRFGFSRANKQQNNPNQGT
jgi:hypothetical protein